MVTRTRFVASQLAVVEGWVATLRAQLAAARAIELALGCRAVRPLCPDETTTRAARALVRGLEGELADALRLEAAARDALVSACIDLHRTCGDPQERS